jgi:hypothetical protein
MWNDGFKENETQSTYSALVSYFNRVFYKAKPKKRLVSAIKEAVFTIFYKIDLCPFFIPSHPKFHYSTIPCG